MGFPLAYCPHGFEVMARLRRLYEDRAQDLVCACMAWPCAALRDFAAGHERGFCAAPDLAERAAFWDAYCRERAAVHDDSIPCAYLSEMDQGLYGGMLGGKVQFMCDPDTGWISSMVSPLIEDWPEFEALRFDRGCEWFQRYVAQLGAFAHAGRGKFGVSHLILIDSLNFVFELFGATRTYLELVENPSMVKRAIDFAFGLNLAVHRTFFEKAPLLEGGTCSNMAQWLPGRVISESVDPFHMTSVEYFEQWGREPLERITGEFDGGATHIHGNGRHLLEAVAAVDGLRVICLGDDKGYVPSFEILPEIRDRVGDMPLIVNVPFEDFQHALTRGELVRGVMYMVKGAPDVDEANRCMDRVRAYRA